MFIINLNTNDPLIYIIIHSFYHYSILSFIRTQFQPINNYKIDQFINKANLQIVNNKQLNTYFIKTSINNSILFKQTLKMPQIQTHSLNQKIPNYLSEIKGNQPFSELQNTEKVLVTQKSIRFECQKNKIRSQLSCTLQTSNKLFLFLFRYTTANMTQIVLYQYLKQDGTNKSMQFNSIQGEITFAKAQFVYKNVNQQNQQNITQQNQQNTSQQNTSQQNQQSISQQNQINQTSQQNKGKKNKIIRENQLQVVLIMGTSQGYIKFINFQQDEQQLLKVYKVQSLKLDHYPIVCIQVLQAQYYFNANLCLALSKTNRTYLINFDSMKVLTFFMPTIVACDVGLSISINHAAQYFIQSTQGGYIIFWNFNPHIMQLIQKSKTYEIIGQKSQCEFKDKQIYHSIIPKSIFHAATIDGLKWIQLYGQILILITKTGILKLLDVSHETINDNQYCQLMSYQIEEGHLVSCVQFYPLSQQLFIGKSLIHSKSNESSNILLKDIKSLSKKSKQIYESAKYYSPKSMVDQRQYVMPQKSGSLNKSLMKNDEKCYFQRIKFGPQLEVEKIDKIYPNQPIQYIDQIRITQSKDIIILKGAQFYLIGATQIFLEID